MDDVSLSHGFSLATAPPGFIDDPYPTYAALRRHSPVHELAPGSWLLSRYDDVLAAYRSPHMSSDKEAEFAPRLGAGTPIFEHHTSSLVFSDPPLHTRVRRLLMGALNQRAITRMEAGVQALVAGLLDRLADEPAPDLIEHFAARIPVEVIGNLLDVPHKDRDPLRDWSLAILSALEPAPGAALLARANAAVTDFCAYLRLLVAERRRRPGDPESDLLTRLLQGDAQGTLDEGELLHNCIFLLNAGHETTTNLIGNGLVALQQFPEQRRRLLAQPELIKPAIEEVLRFESSNQLGNRITTQAVNVGGVELGPQTQITLCIGAANRDPAQFDAPETFDIGRTPNRHLAFGSGIHQCAGMGLARLEGEVAIARFIKRYPHYALAAAPVRGGRARFRGFLSVPCFVKP